MTFGLVVLDGRSVSKAGLRSVFRVGMCKPFKQSWMTEFTADGGRKDNASLASVWRVRLAGYGAVCIATATFGQWLCSGEMAVRKLF